MNNRAYFKRVEAAVEALREGRMIIMMDDDNREQEGDLVIAAEKITSDAINFMTKYARGILCLALPEDSVKRLQIPLMPTRNVHSIQPAFTVSIDAVDGITTGVSAQDRAHTIRVAMHPDSNETDISMPGHVFPLQARQGGVLVRQGHTEGSVDLTRIAHLQPGAVVCEILNEDGTVAKLPQLQEFSAKHNMPLISINDIIEYRLVSEASFCEIQKIF